MLTKGQEYRRNYRATHQKERREYYEKNKAKIHAQRKEYRKYDKEYYIQNKKHWYF